MFFHFLGTSCIFILLDVDAPCLFGYRKMGEEEVKGGPVVPESVLKKQKRNEEWALAKKQEFDAAKKKRAESRKLIFSRAKLYAKEYDEQV